MTDRDAMADSAHDSNAFERSVTRAQFVGRAGRALVTVPLLGGLAGIAAQPGLAREVFAGTAEISLPPAGTTIPTAHVDFSMSPFADDTLPVVGMLKGYFKD